MKVTILGCGAAPGVPAISNGWGRCDPANPKNRRRRASILVEEGATRLLVDTSPDLREQLLAADVRAFDAVIFTHAHADHIHGLDELREVNRAMGTSLAAYAPADAMEVLTSRFDYAFKGIPAGAPIFRPWLVPTTVEAGLPFQIGQIAIHPFLQDHGGSATTGYRFGDVAYSTDLLDLPGESRDVIRGAKLWIVGAYGLTPHPTHAHVDRVLEWAADLKPGLTVITHMSNAIDYETLKARLPENVVPAYDGLVIDV